MKQQYSPLSLCALMALILGGCNQTKQVLGLKKDPPNEFQTMEQPPLEVPPDYTLLPPQPGVRRPQNSALQKPDDHAKEIILESSRGPLKDRIHGRSGNQKPSLGEKDILKKSRASQAEKGIRNTVDKEAFSKHHQQKEDKNWLRKKLPFYKAPPPEDTIDASEEAKRLKASDAVASSKPEPMFPQKSLGSGRPSDKSQA